MGVSVIVLAGLFIVLIVLYKKKKRCADNGELNGVLTREMIASEMEQCNAYKIEDVVDQSLYFSLHQPHSSLATDHRDLIHKLLINIAPKDVLFLYWYDKEQFYESYKTWDDSFRDWVIEQISNNI